MSGTVLVGTQGWRYPAWVGPFYPPGTRPDDMLGVYARAFPSVEVDSTFYGLPTDATIGKWVRRVPPGFVFSLKVPQQITHERRLAGCGELLERFLDRVRPLESRLGALLVQLPADFTAHAKNRDHVAGFCEALPKDVHWAVEFRDPAWFDDETLALLRRCRITLALADGRWVKRNTALALAQHPTADFAYLRWMGPDRQFTDFSRVQADRSEHLSAWSRVMAALSQRVRTVYAYFNNHFQGHSPASARELQQLLGQTPVPPATLREQADLF